MIAEELDVEQVEANLGILNRFNHWCSAHKRTWRELVFVAIMGLFVLEMFVLATHIDTLLSAPIYWWITMPLATVMSARTVTFYGVMSWFRRPFMTYTQDSSWAGFNNKPRRGMIEPLGWLFSCPICVGQHAASILMMIYVFNQALGLAFSFSLALGGISALLHYFNELLMWGSRSARVISGLISPDPGTPGYEARENIYKLLEKDDEN